MDNRIENAHKMLLHACCGPCSMEPIRVLRERGIEPTIIYANSNIAPASEYKLRLDTIRAWTTHENVEFIEDEYDSGAWADAIADVWSADAESAAKEEEAKKSTADQINKRPHEERCRVCYRQRFERAAEYAVANGFDALGTTLSISPYQYIDIIYEELERVCSIYGLTCAFEDYSGFYAEATRRSKAEGLYRQDFCGCAYSKVEADTERAERKRIREEEKARRAEANKAEQKRLETRRQERREYDAKQARKRQILKEMRANKHLIKCAFVSQNTTSEDEGAARRN